MSFDTSTVEEISLSSEQEPTIATSKIRFLLPWFICILGALFYCYEYLLRVSPSVMTHQVMKTYHLEASSFGNLSAMYYYIYIPMQLFVGLLLDRYGPRRLLTMATIACAIGVYFFAATHILFLAEIGRFLMGFGSAFAFVGVLKLAIIWLPPQRFALVTGFTVMLGMIGGMLGDVFLTSLVHMEGWKLTCFLAAIFGVLLALIIFSVIRDTNPRYPEATDLLEHHSVKLVWSELMKIFTNSQFWINGVIGCLLYLSLSAFAELWAIPYLKQVAHFSSQEAGTAASMIFLGWAVGGPMVGWLSDLIQQRRVMLTVGAMVSAILMAIVLYAPDITPQGLMMVLFLCGFFSSTQVLVFPVSREISPPALTGTALAITNMMVMLGGLLVPLIGWILDMAWKGHLKAGVRIYSPAAYQLGLSILPVGFIIAALLTFFLTETSGRRQEDS